MFLNQWSPGLQSPSVSIWDPVAWSGVAPPVDEGCQHYVCWHGRRTQTRVPRSSAVLPCARPLQGAWPGGAGPGLRRGGCAVDNQLPAVAALSPGAVRAPHAAPELSANQGRLWAFGPGEQQVGGGRVGHGHSALRTRRHPWERGGAVVLQAGGTEPFPRDGMLLLLLGGPWCMLVPRVVQNCSAISTSSGTVVSLTLDSIQVHVTAQWCSWWAGRDVGSG